ncbi:hypothetical protein M0811_11576 [Anaeramoeba ignava]|uniref:Peptidase C1A papain C-terminal domain-containing protein n=1 Tax=Anaeramoeba ignava TaxID=1746090 RepID=A0A9Q0R866_ANAIG|nr:hypothetical protein M0811_11576 [Anaeramoeba ignava]
MINFLLYFCLFSIIFSLPVNFDWRNINGISYLTAIRQQHLPQCGSCWAFSTTSSLNDRIKIKRNNTEPDIYLSPQHLLNCAPSVGTCYGGYVWLLMPWIQKNGIVDETCSPYQAIDKECTPINTCKQCFGFNKNCTVIENPTKYYISDWGQLNGEEEMMNEIYKNGPIVCGIACPEALDNWDQGDEIFYDKTGANSLEHWISVVGWGHDDESNLDYWIIRNSWGSQWNKKYGGFFNLVRGINNIGIQKWCYYGNPIVKD